MLGSVALLVLAACGGAGSTAAPTATSAGAAETAVAATAPAETAGAPTTEVSPGGGAGSPAASAPASSAGGHTIDTASGPNGLILTGANGMTVYIYAKDKKKNVSTCTSACATNWPAVTMPAGKTPSAGAAVTGKLATFKRSDGKTQVSYNGAPLYYFAGDSKPGDMNGDGVSGVWSVATPTSTLGGKSQAPAPAPTAGY